MATELAEIVINIGAQIDAAMAAQSAIIREYAKEIEAEDGTTSTGIPADCREAFTEAINALQQAEAEFPPELLFPYSALASVSPKDLLALRPLLKRD